jgi:hypothetical protein
MSEHICQPEPDPVGELLAARPEPASAALRKAILGRTAGVLRRRRWTRRLAWAALLGICYLAGMMTPRPTSPPSAKGPEVATIAVPPAEIRPPTTTTRTTDDGTARALEWQAVEAEVGRSELFRRAGQRHLDREGDLLGAVRCYRHALEKPAPDDLTVHLEDDWLLMALKDARQKEIRNEVHAP